MTLGVVFKDAFQYPLSNLRRLILFGVIVTIGYLYILTLKHLLLFLITVIPSIVAFIFMGGYQLRIIRSTVTGNDELPKLNKLGDMFIDGLILMAVSLAYFLIPVAMGIFAFVLLLSGFIYGIILIFIMIPVFFCNLHILEYGTCPYGI